MDDGVIIELNHIDPREARGMKQCAAYLNEITCAKTILEIRMYHHVFFNFNLRASILIKFGNVEESTVVCTTIYKLPVRKCAELL